MAEQGENPWQQSFRIFLASLAPVMEVCMREDSRLGLEANKAVGMFTSSYQETGQAALILLRARDNLHKAFVWEEGPEGEFKSAVISPDSPVLDAVFQAQHGFSEFVRSWQPLMDSMAGIVWLTVEASNGAGMRRLASLPELARAVQKDDVPEHARAFCKVLTEGAGWYLDGLRVMRNELVHNKRVVTLTPNPRAVGRTIVEIDALGREASERLDLDKFLGTVYGKFLVFCLDFASGVALLNFQRP